MSLHPIRFGAAWLLLVFFLFLWLVLFLAQVKAGTHRPKHHSAPKVGCSSVGCAKVGDNGTYVVHGRIVSVSEPQPGVVCVQTASTKQAGQVCEPK